MKQEDVDKAVDYWLTIARHDHKTMVDLFRSKRYSDSLFFGHIVLEKVFKGLVVKKTKEDAPYTNNLVRLNELAELDLLKEEIDLLFEVNEFNIRSRYPEDKLKFYKMCTREYSGEYLNKIDNLYKKLCQKLKAEKKPKK